MRSIFLLILCFLFPCSTIRRGDTQASFASALFMNNKPDNGDRQVPGKAQQQPSQTAEYTASPSPINRSEMSHEGYYYIRVPFLVEIIGKRIYAAINRPKYKFYIFMTIGTKLPNEQDAIIMLNMLCNFLYSVSVFVGFLCLPRGTMLLLTLVTLLVGPALVLLLLGCLAMTVVAFSLYPMRSVFCLWLYFCKLYSLFQRF